MPETNRVFKPDYRIATLAGLGTAGFIFGCILIFYQDIATPGTTGSVFHEIVYTPTAIIDKLASAIQKVTQDPAVRKTLADQGSTPVGNKPSEFKKVLSTEIEKWGKLVKLSGAVVD